MCVCVCVCVCMCMCIISKLFVKIQTFAKYVGGLNLLSIAKKQNHINTLVLP